MRDGIHRFVGQCPPAPFRRTTTYDVEGAAAPLIAFDADVTQFAGVMTSFALDAVIERAEPVFPHSAYILGFRKEWIFEAPFDTRPISVEIEEVAESAGANEEEQKTVLAVLGAIAKQQTDANANSAG
jgi:sulfur-carrier protein adenylyltransferase/sulfurtransferase